MSERPQPGWEGTSGAALAAYKDGEILVEAERADEVIEKLALLEPPVGPVTAGPPLFTGVAGVARLELYDVGDVAKPLDAVQEAFGEDAPRMSPVHLAMVGQPHIMGNPSGQVPRPIPPPFADRQSDEGADVTIAVIDNGIEDHPWLAGAYSASWRDIEDQRTVVYQRRDVLAEQAGHGLFLSGLVLQYAPAAKLVVMKTSNARGRSEVDAVAAAIVAAGRRGVDIINLSLGLHTRNDSAPWTLELALQEVDPEKTVVVASAGNNADATGKFWPAAFDLPNIIGVGSIEDDDGLWRSSAYSNFGDWVNVYVPANNVPSTYIEYDWDVLKRLEDDTLEVVPERFELWATWSGTSMAAAIFSGALARATRALGVPAPQAAAALLNRDAVELEWVHVLPDVNGTPAREFARAVDVLGRSGGS